jgi:hypothetical protein
LKRPFQLPNEAAAICFKKDAIDVLFINRNLGFNIEPFAESFIISHQDMKALFQNKMHHKLLLSLTLVTFAGQLAKQIALL